MINTFVRKKENRYIRIKDSNIVTKSIRICKKTQSANPVRTDYSLEVILNKQKLTYFGYVIQVDNGLGKIIRQD